MNFLDELAGSIIRILLWILFKFIHIWAWFMSLLKRIPSPKRCPPITNEVLFYSATALAEKIRKKDISCEQVIKAYISRIQEVNPIINAVVEDRFDAALEEARHTDKFIQSTNLSTEELKNQFPLLGLPLTVKESLGVKGMSHGAGQVFTEKKIAEEDCDIVRYCKSAGAIVLLVSNTPELCLNWETVNNVTGRSRNPYDTRRTPGGSSGGEAALISAGASLIGLGSDIAGSLRLPPFFCGIYGHKPTADMVSIHGHYPGCSEKEKWRNVFVVGPLTRYACDLPLIWNVLTEKKHQSNVSLSKLKIYYMENDGGNILTSKIDKEIVQKIRLAAMHMNSIHGCEVEKIKFERLKYSAEMAYLKLLKIDGVDHIFSENKSISAELLRYLTGRSKVHISSIAYAFVRKLLIVVPDKWYRACEIQTEKTRNELCELLNNNGVLFYPCYHRPAHFHGEALIRCFDASYLTIFNALGLPSTTCTVGLHSSGLPIGFQVIASAKNDHLAIAAAEEIEKLYGGWVEPPAAASSTLV